MTTEHVDIDAILANIDALNAFITKYLAKDSITCDEYDAFLTNLDKLNKSKDNIMLNIDTIDIIDSKYDDYILKSIQFGCAIDSFLKKADVDTGMVNDIVKKLSFTR